MFNVEKKRQESTKMVCMFALAEKPVPDSTSEPKYTGSFVFPTQDAATSSQMFVPVSRVLVPVSTARPHTSLSDRVMTISTTPQTTSLHQTAAQTTTLHQTAAQKTARQRTVFIVNSGALTPRQTASQQTASTAPTTQAPSIYPPGVYTLANFNTNRGMALQRMISPSLTSGSIAEQAVKKNVYHNDSARTASASETVKGISSVESLLKLAILGSKSGESSDSTQPQTIILSGRGYHGKHSHNELNHSANLEISNFAAIHKAEEVVDHPNNKPTIIIIKERKNDPVLLATETSVSVSPDITKPAAQLTTTSSKNSTQSHLQADSQQPSIHVPLIDTAAKPLKRLCPRTSTSVNVVQVSQM